MDVTSSTRVVSSVTIGCGQPSLHLAYRDAVQVRMRLAIECYPEATVDHVSPEDRTSVCSAWKGMLNMPRSEKARAIDARVPLAG